MCLTSATTGKQAPTRRHCTWVFSVMNHLNTTTPQDESPRLWWACGWMAKLGRFPMTDSAGAPCTASDTVKDSSVIIACNAAPPALLGGGDGGLSLSGSGQHLDGGLLQPPVTLGPLTTTSHPAVRRGAAGSRPRPPPSRFLKRTADRSGPPADQ